MNWKISFADLPAPYGSLYDYLLYDEDSGFHYVDWLVYLSGPPMNLGLKYVEHQLTLLHDAVADLEYDNLDHWDQFQQAEYQCSAKTGFKCKKLTDDDIDVIMARRKALSLYLEVHKAMPWSICSLASELQLSLFAHEWNTGLVYRDYPLLDGPPQDALVTTLTLRYLWDTNPLDAFTVACDYLYSNLAGEAPYDWQSIDGNQSKWSAEAIVNDLPDWLHRVLGVVGALRLDTEGSYPVNPVTGNSFEPIAPLSGGGLHNPTWAKLREPEPQFMDGCEVYFESGLPVYLLKKHTGQPWGPWIATVSLGDVCSVGVAPDDRVLAALVQSLLRSINIPVHQVEVPPEQYWRWQNFDWEPGKSPEPRAIRDLDSKQSVYCPQTDRAMIKPTDVFGGWYPHLPGRFRWWPRASFPKVTGHDPAQQQPAGYYKLLGEYALMHRALCTAPDSPRYWEMARAFMCPNTDYDQVMDRTTCESGLTLRDIDQTIFEGQLDLTDVWHALGVPELASAYALGGELGAWSVMPVDALRNELASVIPIGSGNECGMSACNLPYYIDFVGLKPSSVLGTNYARIVYSNTFYYRYWLEVISTLQGQCDAKDAYVSLCEPTEVTIDVKGIRQWLQKLARAIWEQETNQTARWDDFKGTPYYDPNWKQAGAPTAWKELSGLDLAEVSARRQALSLRVECNEEFPWRFMDYEPRIQLALFVDSALCVGRNWLGGNPYEARVRLTPFASASQVGDMHTQKLEDPWYNGPVTTANVFGSITDTNPLDNWDEAKRYLETQDYEWQKLPKETWQVQDAILDLADYVLWNRRMGHEFVADTWTKNWNGFAFRIEDCALPPKQLWCAMKTRDDAEAVVQSGPALWSEFIDAITKGLCTEPTCLWLEGDQAQRTRAYMYVDVPVYFKPDHAAKGGSTLPGSDVKVSVSPSFKDMTRIGVSIHGCWSTSTWIQTVLRAINIPVVLTTIDLWACTAKNWLFHANGESLLACDPSAGPPDQNHASVYSPQLDLAMHHGDDPYSNRGAAGLPNSCSVIGVEGRFKWWSRSLLAQATGTAGNSLHGSAKAVAMQYVLAHRILATIGKTPRGIEVAASVYPYTIKEDEDGTISWDWPSEAELPYELWFDRIKENFDYHANRLCSHKGHTLVDLDWLVALGEISVNDVLTWLGSPISITDGTEEKSIALHLLPEAQNAGWIRKGYHWDPGSASLPPEYPFSIDPDLVPCLGLYDPELGNLSDIFDLKELIPIGEPGPEFEL